MANTLTITDLAADIYAARDQVARESVGAINSVTVNAGSEAAAFGDTVRSLKTSQPTLNTTYTPAMTIPAVDDQTISNDTLALDQVANVRIPLTGEVVRSLNNGAGAEYARQQMFAQAFRKISNAIEAYLCGVIYKGGSRAYGTAATTPFASNFNEIAQLRKILFDNGCPVTDGMNSLLLDSLAGVNLRNLAQLQKVNEGGGSDLLRKGELLNLQGFSLKESAGIATHTKGTGASATTNNAGYAVGASTLTLAAAGTGTIITGDVLSFAGDTANKYVVKTGDADVSDGGTIVLNDPGIRVAMSAATKAITVGGTYTANLGFHKSAVELVMRPPAQPPGGDAAIDELTVSDEVSGLTFMIRQYAGYGMQMFDITTFYTAKVWKPEFVAVLLG